MNQAAIAVRPLPWETPARPSPPPVQRLAQEILDRCRGEGPANCVARCPLHVDARGYVQLTRQGHFREALQLVREKLPFPGILGYVCAHPCEQHCKRIDQDAAIRIRDIKRFLAEWEPGDPQHVLVCKPARAERVAVVGSGPSGLLAAHDLRRRGYAVVIFERHSELGGCLRQHIPDWRLPRRVIDRDLSIIAALGIETHTGITVGIDVTIEDLRSEFDAVLLLAGYEGGLDLLARSGGVVSSTRGAIRVDPVTCETGIDGVFAAGDAVSGPSTVVHALAQGRRVAESVHRYLRREDLREKREGLGPARLLWNLGVGEAERARRERKPTMLEPCVAPLADAEAVSEAARCLDCACGLCVRDCEFLSKHCQSPKDLARRVLAGIEPLETRTVAYSCNVCSLCEQVCPEHLDTGRLLLEVRRESVRRGLGPLPQHKPIVGYWKAGVSGPFTLAMAEPGRRRSRRLFFTGCALPAVTPRRTLQVYDQLRKHYPGTGVMMWCCGAPVELLGMHDQFEATRKQILRTAEQLGAEELIAACPDCTHVLKESVPELAITTVWERLAGTWHPPAMREGVEVSVHDSCKARHEAGLHGAVRKLLQESGSSVKEYEYNGNLARCCGFGGMIYPVDPPLSQAITRRRAADTPLPLVTYCAGCRTALSGCGKESVHILDFLLSDDWRQEVARKSPGAIPRYLNRLRTKWAFKRLRPLAGGSE